MKGSIFAAFFLLLKPELIDTAVDYMAFGKGKTIIQDWPKPKKTQTTTLAICRTF